MCQCVWCKERSGIEQMREDHDKGNRFLQARCDGFGRDIVKRCIKRRHLWMTIGGLVRIEEGCTVT